MVKKTVKINTMQEADRFNKICSRFDCDMDLARGKCRTGTEDCRDTW